MLFAVVIVVCEWVYFSSSLKFALLTVTMACAAWAWREAPLFVRRLSVDNEGFATIFVDKVAWEAELCAESFLTHHLCLLKWQCNRGVIWQAVLPDMLPRDDFRRVLLWAKWGQPTNTQRQNRAVQRGEKQPETFAKPHFPDGYKK